MTQYFWNYKLHVKANYKLYVNCCLVLLGNNTSLCIGPVILPTVRTKYLTLAKLRRGLFGLWFRRVQSMSPKSKTETGWLKGKTVKSFLTHEPEREKGKAGNMNTFLQVTP